MNNTERIDYLTEYRCLPHEEWLALFNSWTEDERAYAASIARGLARLHFGNAVFMRGIVEFSNYCRNDCLYCGLRRSNANAVRYRLTPEQILECCDDGYRHGFRTFVLQSGEDAYFTTERLCTIVSTIRERHPDCAVTLSVGELPRADYAALRRAGAERYLLRHESAVPEHYASMHPTRQTQANRMRCLHDLQELGFQTGIGFMVGAPGQDAECLAREMEFYHDFRPQMMGIGPFLPHADTPFAQYTPGDARLTLLLLSLLRIMQPDILLPATTALATLIPDGRAQGILAGANVIMPNLSPEHARRNYLLYNNMTPDAAQDDILHSPFQNTMRGIGYTLVIGRGDWHPEGTTP